MQKILVIGSTGKVGQELVQQLARAGEHIRAATRNPATVTPTPNVEPVAFDYTDRTTFAPALEGVNRVFLMEPQPPLDGPSHQYMVPLVEEAAKSRTKIVLMSSASVAFNAKEPLLEVEAAVKATGRPYVILRPNWFMDNFHTMWIEQILAEGVIPVPAGDSRTAFIDARDVASAAATVLRSDATNCSTLTLSGPEAISYSEAAATISKMSGRSVSYVAIDDATFQQSLLEAGLSQDLAEYLVGIFGPTREGRAAAVSGAVEQLTGRLPRTFAQYAKDRALEWR